MWSLCLILLAVQHYMSKDTNLELCIDSLLEEFSSLKLWSEAVEEMHGKGDMVYVHTQHLQSLLNVGDDCGGAGRHLRGGYGRVGCMMTQRSGPVVPFWAPPHTRLCPQSNSHVPVQVQPPPWRDSPWLTASWSLGFLGRPSSTCLTLTPTTAADVTRLLWCRLCSRPTSWHLNIHIVYMLKTHRTFSLAVALR